LKIIKIYFLAIIFIGCSVSKSGTTDICLYERGVPSKISEIQTVQISNNKIGTIRGHIKNRLDSLPNTDAIIVSDDFPEEIGYYSTDESGFFEFQIAEGNYEIKFGALGINDLKKNVIVKNGQAIVLDVYLGIGNSWTDFSTNNPRELKKKIRKQNRKRKRKYGR